VLVDRHGIPLASWLTAANVPDVTMLETLVEAIEPIRQRRGRPRQRPAKLHGDLGYASTANRTYLHRRGIGVRLARKGIESRERLGRYRWVVERTLSWLHGFRRLQVRYERQGRQAWALLDLACALICFRFLHVAQAPPSGF
jgi:transposase